MPNSPHDTVRTLAWNQGRAEVQRLGAMLGPVAFRAPGRADFQPMHVAPWADEPAAGALPGILRRLRGEWPCVPFGRVDDIGPLPHGWTPLAPDDGWGHGYGAHHAWDWLPQDDPSTCRLGITYPDDSPVRRLERTVRAVPDEPTLDVTLQIDVRRHCTLPVALHPTLRLDLGRVALRVSHRGACFSYPVSTAPDLSRLMRDAGFADLARAPAFDGGAMDLSRYPQAIDSEELVQLTDIAAPVQIAYPDQGWTLDLAWDTALLPDAMLWVSHRGRGHAPWNGRHLALGVEPVNGVFDLGRVAAPPPDHPLARRRGIVLDPERPTILRYRLSAIAT